ncbi:hypothetical protein [Streptomyces sp. NPDC088350]|uniref:hypothetical protein n=1 Tax=Streptomyces sp. NPDC088350 TaxID=3365854 RepID=UPI00381993E2
MSGRSHQDTPDLDDLAPASPQVSPRSMCDAEPNHPGDLPFRLLDFRTAALDRAAAETNGGTDPLEDAATLWDGDNWVTGTSDFTS